MSSPTFGFPPLSSQHSTSQSQTRLRLRIAAADQVSVMHVLEELKVCCGITLQTAPIHSFWSQTSNHTIDLDLQGPLSGIQQALRRLQTFPITIQGRANPDGDSWYC